ncbi:MAG TPA: polyprenyl synthetase family protein [Nitrososphaerales archaeon]|nr:polyprenyl synthetase family protein [Nitrososphaerales archaeon]
MAKKDLEFFDKIEVKTKLYLERINGAIEAELSRYSDSRFHGPLRYALEGGKRIRPLLLLLAAEAVGRSDDEKVLDAAVAVELLHAESIIHDDIIDQEASRRGRAAFHVKYGYSTSLLTADFVFAMILSIAARYQDRRVATTISNAAMNMCEGEYAELTIDPGVYPLEWDEYLEVISKKTAALFETSVRLGGLVGGASPEKLEALTEYGRCLGIAYQIHDDILDWGAEDKITAALKRNADERLLISRLQSMTDSYAKKAKSSLSVLGKSEAASLLTELADFSVQRDY